MGGMKEDGRNLKAKEAVLCAFLAREIFGVERYRQYGEPPKLSREHGDCQQTGAGEEPEIPADVLRDYEKLVIYHGLLRAADCGRREGILVNDAMGPVHAVIDVWLV
ncbi:hypothetical protein LTR09_008417 [Extremus antarcticus]|uniref:Uncharacterized protein n=1 Tax=Extremus antarcticus TaxID=702011 RepID=A0AAJ0DAG4_9PEZI|nr:hypothetical protein LTR09_008417 [Extremus antarcticus]